MGGNDTETENVKQARRASLGQSLIAAREKRGLSRQSAVEQTHIPAHYVQMLEDDDYRRISDQLYLLPFLRKYASFLEIDQDETAMRLLHEVQRVDNSPSPIRLDQPPDDVRRYRRYNLSKLIMFGGLIAVIIGAWIFQTRHTDSDMTNWSKPQSSSAGLEAPPAAPSTVNSASTASSNATWSRPDSAAAPQAELNMATSVQQPAQPVNHLLERAARAGHSVYLRGEKTPPAGKIPNRD